MAINRNIICLSCSGIGCIDKNKIIKCIECNGRKVKITSIEIQPGMTQQIRSKCDNCQGSGKTIPKEYMCKKCNGSKVIKE